MTITVAFAACNNDATTTTTEDSTSTQTNTGITTPDSLNTGNDSLGRDTVNMNRDSVR